MPLYIKIGKVKHYLNLNKFSTWHFQLRNKIKTQYMELAESLLNGIKMTPPVRLTFVHYFPDRRKRDRANVCCVHEKFFCDSMSRSGAIPDDNDNYIKETRYISGGLDKTNARIDIIVEEI